MSAVQYYDIHLCIHQRRYPVKHIGSDAHPRAAKKPALLVLGCQRIFDGLLDVLDGNKPLQVEVLVHYGKLFLSGLCQYLLRLLQSDAFGSRDQPLAGHGFLDLFGEIRLELQIPVGDDAHQLVSLRHGNSGDAEFSHQSICICQCVFRSQRKWIGDDPVFRTLDLVHLLGLSLDGHILVDDSDAALSGHSNGHTMLRHCVHPCAHHRNVQLDLLGQPSSQIHLIRHYLRVCRHQQHIIKGNALTDNLSHFSSSCVYSIM